MDDLEQRVIKIVDKMDDSILGFNKNLAEYWQNKTYKSKDSLSRGMHASSSCAFLYNTKFGNFLGPFVSYTEITRFFTGIKNPDYECSHFPNDTSKKLWNMALYSGGIISSLTGLGCTTYGIISKDSTLMNYGLGFFSGGAGLYCWKTGDYLDKIKISRPPEKKQRKSLIEWIKERAKDALLPQSIIPEPAYNSFSDKPI